MMILIASTIRINDDEYYDFAKLAFSVNRYFLLYKDHYVYCRYNKYQNSAFNNCSTN